MNIIVNGEQKTIDGDVLPYTDACEMAGFDGQRILSVTVRNPDREGKCLIPGACIFVKDGAIINVADTSGT